MKDPLDKKYPKNADGTRTLKLSGKMRVIDLNAPAGPYLGLSDEQFARFKRACTATWDVIASDVAGSALGGDEECKKLTSMPWADVIEVVLDGGHIELYGDTRQFRALTPPWKTLYADTISPWITKHYGTEEFNALMKLVFPHERYDTQ